ncbi:MAG: pyridoxamine 5'-phosphate oxidase family protein [Negativicutes bacterium]|nr:pyridoxamine 5'-phosphate oxidase family protein [Negativicutes bacterium]
MPKKWLTDAEAREYLAARIEGRLATVDPDGQPYITPLNYIVHQDKIYFHCAVKGHKMDNIAADSRVCFEVSHTDKSVFAAKTCECSTRYTSVLVFGRARLLESVEEKVRILSEISARFAAGRPYEPVEAAGAAGCSVVEVSIEKISGKRNIDPPGAD